MNKKELDKLFQDNLKDYRESPDERVWESIENSLDQKKKSRRVIPIWWKLGGTAAVLLIALFLINPFGTQDVPDTIITDTEQIESPVNSDQVIEQRDSKITDDAPESSVVQTEESSPRSTTQSAEGSADAVVENDARLSSDPVANVDTNNQDVVAQKEESLNNTPDQELETDNIAKKEAVALAQNQEDQIEDQSQPIESMITGNDELQDKENVSEASMNTPAIAEESEENNNTEESGKKSIFDEIKKQEEEKEALAAQTGPKWSVGPSVAPVYFSSFGEGSPIHSNFVSNSKSGNVNLSYGVAVAYELSDKLSVRSGLHRVDYGYNTDDITFSSSLVASTSTQITNINYTNTSRNLVVESSSNPVPSQEVAVNDIVAQSPSRSGTMVQEFGYLEVPMELNYSLLDRKFNINVIGGISSLFLVNNNVTLESGDSSTEMGEANNLNDVNFSTNVGLGMNYELTDKMKVHLEPMFKYQLNTFSETEGNFQPYSLGIYTGLSFKF